MQTALIFGASKGIGRSLAFELARKNYRVVLCARTTDLIERWRDDIVHTGGYASSITCDVSKHVDIERAINQTINEFGSIELTVFCAGESHRIDIESLHASEYQQTFDVNFHSVVHGVSILVPHMKARAGGTIVGISSLNDGRPLPGNSAYVASKAALTAYLEAAAIELRPHGISVVCVRPGFVDTEMTKNNRTPRPFLMTADRAALIIVNGIEKGRQRIQFPWPLVLASSVSKILPAKIWQYLISSRFNERIPLILVLICGLVLFIGLGRAELQPWDEAFYAVRALAIVDKGAWWDQTAYSLGGLYTSTYPPLTEWFMAASMHVFGSTPLAVRLYGAVCGVALLGLTYLLAREFVDRRSSILAIVILSGSLTFNTYARTGMLDVPLVMWCTLVLYGVVKSCKSTDEKHMLTWLFVIAIATVAAFMTKIVLPILLLLFLIYPLFGVQRLKTTLRIAAAMCAGLLLALPWHISMFATHGSSFTDAFLMPHWTSPIQGGGRPLGALYYINQLIVASPFFVLAFVLKRSAFKDKGLEVVLSMWFVIGLIALSFAATKFAHYTVLLIVPASLLAARTLAQIRTSIGHSSTVLPPFVVRGLLVLVVVAFAWSLSQPLRDVVQQFLFLAIVVGASEVWRKADKYLFRMVAIALPLTLLIANAVNNLNSADNGVTGGRATAEWLEHSNHTTFGFMYHEFDPSDSHAPQLAWYTEGWPTGWRDGYTMKRYPMPFSATSDSVINSAGSQPAPVVYYVSTNDSLAKADIASIMQYKRIALRTKNYVVFE